MNDSYVETFNERLQVREKFFHRVLLWIERKILGSVLEHGRHLLVHALEHFKLLLGSVQKLVQSCQGTHSQLERHQQSTKLCQSQRPPDICLTSKCLNQHIYTTCHY